MSICRTLLLNLKMFKKYIYSLNYFWGLCIMTNNKCRIKSFTELLYDIFSTCEILLIKVIKVCIWLVIVSMIVFVSLLFLVLLYFTII